MIAEVSRTFGAATVRPPFSPSLNHDGRTISLLRFVGISQPRVPKIKYALTARMMPIKCGSMFSRKVLSKNATSNPRISPITPTKITESGMSVNLRIMLPVTK